MSIGQSDPSICFGAITLVLIFHKFCLCLSYTCAHKSGAFALSFGITFARIYYSKFDKDQT